MALEGTHLRFALEVKDTFGVTDLNKYLSGAIYPDSRYVTKTDRILTHDKSYHSSNFYLQDDFKKGWVSHLICDQAQYDLMIVDFADLLEGLPPTVTHGDENWIVRTTIKILQDMSDVRSFDIKPYLHHLDYVENPNGEDPSILKDYNLSFKKFYQNVSTDIDKMAVMLGELGIEDNLVEKLVVRARLYQQNPLIIQRVEKLYQKTVDIHQKYLL